MSQKEIILQRVELRERFKRQFLIIKKILCKGILYLGMNEFDQSLTFINNAIQLDPKCEAAYLSRGNWHKAMKNLKAAFEDYSKAIELDEYYAEAHAQRGKIYLEKNQFLEAKADYKSVVNHYAKGINYYLNQGIIYQKLHLFVKAGEKFNMAFLGQCQNPEVYYKRGIIFKYQQSLPRAIDDLTEAFYLQPNNLFIIIALVKVNIAKNNIKSSKQLIIKAINILKNIKDDNQANEFNLTQDQLAQVAQSILLTEQINLRLLDINSNVKKLKDAKLFTDEDGKSYQKILKVISDKILSESPECKSSEEISNLEIIIGFLEQEKIRQLSLQCLEVENQKVKEEFFEKQDQNKIKLNLDKLSLPENITNIYFINPFALNCLFFLRFVHQQNQNNNHDLIKKIEIIVKTTAPLLFAGLVISVLAIEKIFEFFKYNQLCYKNFQILSEQNRKFKEIQIASFELIERIDEKQLINVEYQQQVDEIVKIEQQTIKETNNIYWQLGVQHSLIVLGLLEIRNTNIQKEFLFRNLIIQSHQQNMVQDSQQTQNEMIQIHHSTRCCQIF